MSRTKKYQTPKFKVRKRRMRPYQKNGIYPRFVPYGGQNTKTKILRLKNANRSYKKSVRQQSKQIIKQELENKY